MGCTHEWFECLSCESKTMEYIGEGFTGGFTSQAFYKCFACGAKYSSGELNGGDHE